jgi:hypothetical protein
MSSRTTGTIEDSGYLPAGVLLKKVLDKIALGFVVLVVIQQVVVLGVPFKSA